MSKSEVRSTAIDAAPPRRPYVAPTIRRVDLALEETLSAGCKVWGSGSDCGVDEFSFTSESGS